MIFVEKSFKNHFFYSKKKKRNIFQAFLNLEAIKSRKGEQKEEYTFRLNNNKKYTTKLFNIYIYMKIKKLSNIFIVIKQETVL